MDTTEAQAEIEELWTRRNELSPADEDAKAVVHHVINLLDTGQVRVAEVAGSDSGSDIAGSDIAVNEWLKYAILLLFRLSAMETTELGPFEFADKIPLKSNYQQHCVRVVPGA